MASFYGSGRERIDSDSGLTGGDAFHERGSVPKTDASGMKEDEDGFFSSFGKWWTENESGRHVASKAFLAFGSGVGASRGAGGDGIAQWGAGLNAAGRSIEPSREYEEDQAGDTEFSEWADNRLKSMDPESAAYRVLDTARGRGRGSDRMMQLLPSLLSAESADKRTASYNEGGGGITSSVRRRNKETRISRRILIKNPTLIDLALMKGENNHYTRAIRGLEGVEDPDQERFTTWASRYITSETGYGQWGALGVDDNQDLVYGEIEKKPTNTKNDDPDGGDGGGGDEEESSSVLGWFKGLFADGDGSDEPSGEAALETTEQTAESILDKLANPGGSPSPPRATEGGISKSGSPGLGLNESPGVTNISKLNTRREQLDARRQRENSQFWQDAGDFGAGVSDYVTDDIPNALRRNRGRGEFGGSRGLYGQP